MLWPLASEEKNSLVCFHDLFPSSSSRFFITTCFLRLVHGSSLFFENQLQIWPNLPQENNTFPLPASTFPLLGNKVTFEPESCDGDKLRSILQEVSMPVLFFFSFP